MKTTVPGRQIDQCEPLEREDLQSLLERVKDPELPVLSIIDLGILRDISVDGGKVTVAITPTYSGCPAMGEIRRDIRAVLEDAGFRSVRIETVLHPAWSSDWLTDQARAKLREYGIAPPAARNSRRGEAWEIEPVCPQCGSRNTRVISDFGSAPCKALHKCRACLEPFESFKCI